MDHRTIVSFFTCQLVWVNRYDNPAIAEKDYYVVQLLKLLASHYCQHHTMVFAGGTALAKADVKLSYCQMWCME